jgi:lysozyme family protein
MNLAEFTSAFEILIGHEGGYSDEAQDPGNWTGNAVGVGLLRGTKYGIASGSYSTELEALPQDARASMPASVADLTLDQAQAIYRVGYWDRVCCDALPPPLALLVFDAAVNNGVGRAALWLQEAAGAAADGDIGPQTLAAVTSAAAREGGAALCAEFMARRLMFMASLPTWPVFGLGWARRLSLLPFQAMTMTGATP